MSKGNLFNEKDSKAAKGSAKSQATVESTQEFDFNGFFRNVLALPDIIQDDISKHNQTARWINRNEFMRNFNTRQGYWVPYIAPESLRSGGIGADPDGHLVRGDLLLAVRPKQATEAYKKLLEDRNQAHKNYNQIKAKEMRRAAREAQVDMIVDEGYGKDDSDD